MTAVETFNYAVGELPNLWGWAAVPAATFVGSIATSLVDTRKGKPKGGGFINTVATLGLFLSLPVLAVGFSFAYIAPLVAEKDMVLEQVVADTGLGEEATRDLWMEKEIVSEGHRYEILPNSDNDGYTLVVTDLEEAE